MHFNFSRTLPVVCSLYISHRAKLHLLNSRSYCSQDKEISRGLRTEFLYLTHFTHPFYSSASLSLCQSNVVMKLVMHTAHHSHKYNTMCESPLTEVRC